MCFSQNFYFQKKFRGHTDLNHGPIGLQPIALPLSYIPKDSTACKFWGGSYNCISYYTSMFKRYVKWCRPLLLTLLEFSIISMERRWYNGQHSCLPSS